MAPRGAHKRVEFAFRQDTIAVYLCIFIIVHESFESEFARCRMAEQPMHEDMRDDRRFAYDVVAIVNIYLNRQKSIDDIGKRLRILHDGIGIGMAANACLGGRLRDLVVDTNRASELLNHIFIEILLCRWVAAQLDESIDIVPTHGDGSSRHEANIVIGGILLCEMETLCRWIFERMCFVENPKDGAITVEIDFCEAEHLIGRKLYI